MTTEKKTETTEVHPLFGTFLRNRMEKEVPHLLGPAPAGAVDIDADRERFRQASVTLWNRALSSGYTEREICGLDQPPESSQGRPVRLPPSRASVKEEEEARVALHELRRRGLDTYFSAPLMVHLDEASRGVFTSARVSLQGAIREAKADCTAYDVRLASKARAEAALIPVEVMHRCGYAPQWMPGVHQWTAEQVALQRQWDAGMQNQPEGRTLQSLGYGIWPCWRLLDDTAPTAAASAKPQPTAFGIPT